MKTTTKIVAAVVALGLVCGATAASAESIIERLYTFSRPEESLPVEDISPKRGNSSPTNRDKLQETDETRTCETAGGAAYSWYFKHTKDGARPPIPPEMSFIENHGGYFLGKDEPVIYLTFDAGYENGNIEKILDTLKSENVPGAFFILDNLVLKNTDLVLRMAEEGHTVCNHTAKHRDMTMVSSFDEFARELSWMEQIYKDTTGYDLAKYYRPPEGKFNEANLEWADSLGYKTIFWSFAYADWDNEKQMSPERAIEKIISETHNGEVILLHPTSRTNAEILPALIKKWREMGYRFGNLDELTGAR